jgi:diguanylate cyclase (GGDEF)-like protein
VLFIDIDHFKEYNDSYGHQAGDAALTAVARCIGAKLRRPADFAARYGGEEFVVVLPDTDEDGAHVVAQTLRRAVSALDITDVAGGRRVTVSIGAATWTAHAAREASAILKAADEALYLAKAAGRNTVFTAQLA